MSVNDRAALRRSRNVALAHCLAAMAFAAAAPARADIWGYVDESGTARTSPTKLDDRYQLFFKGESTLGLPDADADAAAEAALQSRTAFARNPAFQRAPDQRNVARFLPLIEEHARLQQLDPALVKAVIAVESNFQPDAVSVKGAVGLMQIIPDTGERYGVVGDATRTIEQKLRDPAINLRVGTRYLRDLLVLFANDLELALAAYNAGENTVKRYANTIPPFAETQQYVKMVQQFLAFYRPQALVPVASPRQVLRLIPGRRNPLGLSGDAAQ
jgi:soluble lytic murein transglycosylase-like protein